MVESQLNTQQPTIDGGTQTIHSRFGDIDIDFGQSVFFPSGLLGIGERLHFGLTEIPRNNMGQFRLLQCLNDHSLSFVVLPVDIDNRLIARKDIEDACEVLNIPMKRLLTMLIISVKNTPDSVVITANARAPIFIDTEDKAGIQYVFPHNRYDVRTSLT